ncbi:type I polyketide synthase, partial [Catenulispora rubra]|uniref:type I polyketide synthase n=1 Tax=Catenulispora rubra TaxID=280293 RepID=UPI001892205D
MPKRAESSLFELTWAAAAPSPDTAIETGETHHVDLSSLLHSLGDDTPAPGLLIHTLQTRPEDDPDGDTGAHLNRLHQACADHLALLAAFLTNERLQQAHLLVTTRHATTAAGTPNPVHAAIWALTTVAQNEHPDRITLLDTDTPDATAISQARASGHRQSAWYGNQLHTPRLQAAKTSGADHTPALDPDGTVLITGGTGALAGHIAAHLVEHHGIRHLVLAGRRGPAHPEAARTIERLTALGAEPRLVACDTTDPDQLKALLSGIDAAHPLTGVIHTAGVMQIKPVTAMTADDLAVVLRPKADTAALLHGLTADLPLTQFVGTSSIAATLGSPGQGNYAAANAYLEALAHHRKSGGRPATTVAWGPWEDSEGMISKLPEAAVAQLTRTGIIPLSTSQGLALFDSAVRHGAPHLVASRLSRPALRTQAANGSLHPLLATIAPEAAPSRSADDAASERTSFAARIAALDPTQQRRTLLEMVRHQAAIVLAHTDDEAIDIDRAFKDSGFDSLTTVQLSKRLSAATGLSLPTTIIYGEPTPKRLAEALLGLLTGGGLATSAARTVSGGARTDEPLAIVGMACRLPGGISNADQLWTLLDGGGDAIGAFPDNRGWDLDALYDPDPDHGGTSYTRHGGFLHNAGEFDPAFFGMSPREATATDPQQRLLLELAWETLEDANIDPTTLQGTQTGVYAGVGTHEYEPRVGDVSREFEGFMLAGNHTSVVSGRIAYSLGLSGPAITVNTACSSSLVAVHLAGQSLRNGECDLALAGGVAVMATPAVFVEFSRQRGLSADGRCKAFAEAADGTGWSEGAALLLLERLSDAEANGHRIHAVVRGSAINQDGASNGLTAPNGPAQQRVITAALTSAGLAPGDVDVIEAHGTGTTLGDPIEAGALNAAYGERPHGRPLYLGSLKSNIGHTQAAAGAAGIIKMVQAMRHGTIPQTLHVDAPSHHIDWEAGPLELATTPIAWPQTGQPRRAGISAFGVSGTNAHLILEQPPATAPAAEQALSQKPDTAEARTETATEAEAETGTDTRAGTEAGIGAGASTEGGAGAEVEVEPVLVMLPISARSTAALRDTATRLLQVLDRPQPPALPDIAHTLTHGRARLPDRAVALATDHQQAREALLALAAGREHPDLTVGTAIAGEVCYLFSGQGSQRPGMAAGLYRTFPVFKQALEEACEACDQHLEQPLLPIILDNQHEELLATTAYTQPALFAIHTALYRLLLNFAPAPALVAGHSIGELSAAQAAGILTLTDAAKLITTRARLMHTMPPGTMLTAHTGPERIEELLLEHPDIDIAAYNSPTTTTLAGPPEAITALAEALREHGINTRTLHTAHAYHSRATDPILDDFRTAAQQVTWNQPTIPLITATPEPATTEQLTDPEFWTQQIRRPVHFHHAITHTQNAGTTGYLELGPDTTLTTLTKSTLDDAPDTWAAPTLHPKQSDTHTLFTALAHLHTHGTPITWPRNNEGRHTDLPTYPFQHHHLWLPMPERGSGRPEDFGLTPVAHPLLTSRADAPDGTVHYTGRVEPDRPGWIPDHAIGDTPVLPGAAIVDLALTCAAEHGPAHLDELTLHAPVIVTDATELHLTLTPPDADGHRAMTLHARQDGDQPWTLHATATTGNATGPGNENADALTSLAPDSAGWQPVALDQLYPALAAHGYNYGPTFQAVAEAYSNPATGQTRTRTHIITGDTGGISDTGHGYAVHPALLDAAFHPQAAPGATDTGQILLPHTYTGVTLHSRPGSTLHATVGPGPGDDTLTLSATDAEGTPLLSIEAVHLRPTALRNLTAAPPMLQLTWTPAEMADAAADAGSDGHGWTTAATAADISALSQRIEQGEPAPSVLIHAVASRPEDDPDSDPQTHLDRLHQACADHLALLTEFLTDERLQQTRLLSVTRYATTAAGTAPNPVHAAIWALTAVAQSEHPDRITQLDTDIADTAAFSRIPASGHDQAAWYDDQLLSARLRPTETVGDDAVDQALDPRGTVLITGGTGAIAGHIAAHLAEQHGIRHLILAGRRGPDHPDAEQITERLTALGADPQLVACDTADPEQLAALLKTIDPAHPLTAVVHTAAVLHDAQLTAQTAQNLDHVLRAKADTAAWLHHLTAEAPLAQFVLTSSTAAVLGTPGQANYAAANAYLDALAHHRRAHDRPATAIAYGLWQDPTP